MQQFTLGMFYQTTIVCLGLLLVGGSPTNAQHLQELDGTTANRFRQAIHPAQTGATYVDPDDGKRYADLEQQKALFDYERLAFANAKQRPQWFAKSKIRSEVILLLEAKGYMEVDKLEEYIDSIPGPTNPKAEAKLLKSTKNSLSSRLGQIKQLAASPGGAHLNAETWKALTELHQHRLDALK